MDSQVSFERDETVYGATEARYILLDGDLARGERLGLIYAWGPAETTTPKGRAAFVRRWPAVAAVQREVSEVYAEFTSRAYL